MQMSRYFVCCEECFECIGKRNTNAAKLWMDLCALKIQSQETINIHSDDIPELRALETLGFVVSTDREKCLSIHVKGHYLTDDGQDFFCLKEGNHEHA